MNYLVQIISDGNLISTLLMPYQIINHIDMLDCTSETLYVFDISTPGKVKPLEICGCWHNPADPLYIKVIDEDGNTVFDGYGTDH